MTGQSVSDQETFQRILQRNIALPLIAGIATALAFVGLIFYLLSAMNWVEHSERVIGSANKVAKLAVDQETGMRGFLLTGDESFLEPYKLGKPKMDVDLDALKELVSDSQPQLERVNRIDALQEQWYKTAEFVITLKRNNGNYAEVIRSGRAKIEFEAVRQEFTDFLDVEQRLRQQRSESTRTVTFITIAAFLFLSLSLSALLAFFGRRELLQLSSTYGIALKEHADHAEVLQQQAWLRAGQTQLAERAVGQLALPLLGNTVLEFLSLYLDVAVAALYVRQDDGSLQRVATYGFKEENESFGKSFKDREGLVGQAASERRLIHLESVPNNYLKVNSGLGESASANVLLLPVDNDGTVNGVIELGFLHETTPRDVEFLKLVAGNIGTSIEAARYRQLLQDALAETQQLNEELQVQQEELRTSQRRAGRTVARPGRIAGASGKPAGRTGTDERAAGRAGRRAGSEKCRAATRCSCNWKNVRTNCSARANTNRSSSPTCRTSCARRSTAR